MLSEDQLDAIKKMAGDIIVDVKKSPSTTHKAAGSQPVPRRASQKQNAALIKAGEGPNNNRCAGDQNGVGRSSNGRRKADRQGGGPHAAETRSSVDANIEPINEPASKLPQAGPLTAHRSRREAQNDENWSLDHLRWSGDRAYGDLANVLRIFDHHPDFAGRFRFNKSMGKVMNKGTVMLGWQLDETVAIIQERFIPEVAPETVIKSLMICANRNCEKPLD